MAVIIFETASQEQAAGFNNDNGDILAFSQGVSASSVSVVAAAANGLTNPSITVTSGGKSLTFPASELSEASRDNRIQFSDNSRLILGTGGADADLTGTASTDVIYGFEGNDVITGGGNGDQLYGGIGADTIDGGTGNDRIYGNDLGNTAPAGATDGADVLNGGSGGDYIQGNMGSDNIDGGTGSDRLFGGQGNDVIFGGGGTNADGTIDLGNDTVNGNRGNDIIDGGTGDDFLRGGQDDDSILGGADNDQLFGDLGNDTLIGGIGLDILTGGDGTNTFVFDQGDALFTTQGGTFANITDQIVDFKLDTDAFLVNDGDYDQVIKDNGVTLNTVEAGRTYAQGLLNDATIDHTSTVAAVQVGTDTYIFWDGNNDGTVESAVRLNGINVTDVTTSSLFSTSDLS